MARRSGPFRETVVCPLLFFCPTGAAKALLKVLDKAPEAALAALD